MMVPTQNDVFAHQYDIASRQFKTLRRRFPELGMAVSKSHNAVYGHADVLRVLSLMSDRKMFVRSAVTHLRRKVSKDHRQQQQQQQHDGGTVNVAASSSPKKGGAYSSRTPHPDWILKTIRSVSPDQTQRWCNSMLQHTVRNGRRSGMLHNTDVVAVDVTDIEYYGKGLKDVARKSKPKNGTSTFLSHITVHVGSDDGSDLVLSSLQLPKDAKLADFVPKMIRKTSRSGMKIRMFLYDRGFFNVNCMVAAGKSQGCYVMPAVKNKRIKAAIEEYLHGKRDAISDYTMTNKEGKSVTFRLVIVKKKKEEEDENKNEDENNDTAKEECTEKKKKEKKKETADECLVFATDMPAKSVEAVIAHIPEEYRMRWGIETGFRVIKGVMGKTCSNSPAVRMLLFYMPLILYNLWRTAIFMDVESKWDGFAGGKGFTMALFVACITDAAGSFVNDRGK